MNAHFGHVVRWWRNGDAESAAKLPIMRSLPMVSPEAMALEVPQNLTYPSTTLAKLLDQTADRFGDNVALIYNDKSWTYRELLTSVNRMAGALARLGVRRGHRVLMVMPNCREFITSFFAIQKLGAIVVNAGPLMGQDDLKQVIAMTTPHVGIGLDLQLPTLVRAGANSSIEHWVWVSLEAYQSVLGRLGYRLKLWRGREPLVDASRHVTLDELMDNAPARPPTVEPTPDQVAVLQPTGGTTGTLKLAQLSHKNLLANATQVSVCMGCRPGQERVFTVLPMFHIYGLTTCLTSGVMSAAQIILQTRFQAQQTLDLVRKHKPTIFPIVPAICEALSNEIERQNPAGERFEGLRMCLSGAAPLSKETAERFERLTGARPLEGYGLTEAGPVTHSNLIGRSRHGTIGQPLPDTTARVVDLETGQRDCAVDEPGELLVSGPQIMLGYFADPDNTHKTITTDAAGVRWLHTGDIVTKDADGYFCVVDRKKDMIIRSGLKVYPARVEHVLKSSDLLSDVAVIGRPDPVHTERVVAVVVPKQMPKDTHGITDQLRGLCKQHLSPYEVPAKFEFVDAIPRSALGKVLKAQLRKKMPVEPANDPDPSPQPTKPLLNPEAA